MEWNLESQIWLTGSNLWAAQEKDWGKILHLLHSLSFGEMQPERFTTKVHLLAVWVPCTWHRTFLKQLVSHGVTEEQGLALSLSEILLHLERRFIWGPRIQCKNQWSGRPSRPFCNPLFKQMLVDPWSRILRRLPKQRMVMLRYGLGG